jgi:hypothetical protein
VESLKSGDIATFVRTGVMRVYDVYDVDDDDNDDAFNDVHRITHPDGSTWVRNPSTGQLEPE